MPRKKPSQLTEDDARIYVADHAMYCPCCGSHRLRRGAPTAESTHARREVACLSCRAIWFDSFDLRGIQVFSSNKDRLRTLDGTPLGHGNPLVGEVFVAAAAVRPPVERSNLYWAPILPSWEAAGVQIHLKPVAMAHGVDVATIGVFSEPWPSKRRRRRAKGSGETPSS